MTTVTMVDPIDEVIVELRAYAPLVAELGVNVPLGVVSVWGGALPAGVGPNPRPYVIVRRLSLTRNRRAGVTYVRASVIATHMTERQAALLYGLCSDALDIRGPRSSGGTSIFQSKEEIGGQPTTDPQTSYPQELGIFEIFTADRVTP